MNGLRQRFFPLSFSPSFPRERKAYVSSAIIIPSSCPEAISLVPEKASLRDPPVAQGGASILVLDDRMHCLLIPWPGSFYSFLSIRNRNKVSEPLSRFGGLS